jgi:hypothetical protein
VSGLCQIVAATAPLEDEENEAVSVSGPVTITAAVLFEPA